MAKNHAVAYADMDGVQVVAGVDPNGEQLSAFQAEFDIPNGFASVDDALAWGAFDAVSNVTQTPSITARHCQCLLWENTFCVKNPLPRIMLTLLKWLMRRQWLVS